MEEAKQEAIDTAKEYTTLKSYRETYIDLRAEKWDQDTYYPVTIKLPINETRIEVTTELGDAKPKWSTHEYGFSMNCVWRSNRSGWGASVVNRIIEVFGYRFTEQNIHPAGSIGQLTSSSEELIYLRGGGRYTFRIGNNCVAVVHDSRYTAPNGTAVAPVTSVIRPVITNATKTEFDSQITQLKDSINLRVTKTDYDKNNQDLNQSIGNLQTSYNSISGTVSSLNTRLQTVEKAGYITTSQGNTLYASKKLENGNELISYINQDATNTTIKAKNINLNGAISANGNIQITTDGKLIAVNGEFTGKITATSGIIGGFEIGSTYIQNGGLKLSSGSIEYKKDKLQSNFGALYTGITGIATGLYIKNTAISTMNRHELCAYFQGSIGDLQINSSKAMIETYNVSSMHYALYIPSGQVYMNANSGGIFFKNVQNVNGKSNYYLCIDRSTGQLYYR